MAYFLKQNEDQNNQNQQTQNVGGNIYSTSGGEVSSQIDNNSNSNNSSNSNSSNSSGNWVNLNSYLDANQNKAGRYANTFVESDLNKGQDYKNNLQNAQNQYLSSIKSDNAYTYNASQDNSLIPRYLRDSKSLSNEEKNRAMNILKGYQGEDYFQNTGDKYGYNELKKGSDDFINLSKNILNENYLKSQMGNNVSTGGKNLNSFVLGGSDDSRNVLNNASNQFSQLSSLLDSTNNTLNTERDNVVSKATKNKENYDRFRRDMEKDFKDSLKYNYQQGLYRYFDQLENDQKNPLVNNNPHSNEYDNRVAQAKANGWIAGNETYKVRDDLRKQAKAQFDRELQELENRSNSLLGNVSLNDGNGTFDKEFKFVSDWRDPNSQELENQIRMTNKFFNEIAGPRWTYGEDPDGLYDQILKAYTLNKITDDQAKQYLAQIKRK